MKNTLIRSLLMSTFLIAAVPAFAETSATSTATATAVPATMGKTAMGTALLDAKGMALYTYEADPKGKSTCNGDCAAIWIPLPVAEGSVPPGEGWSVVVRDDGTRQWAFMRQPLYTYVSDKAGGEVTGDGVGGFHLAGLSDEERVAFEKASYAVAVMGSTDAGPAWVDSKGMALYTYEKDGAGKSMCNGDCATGWPPLMVADGAVANGDWSIVVRDDGTKMWALKGMPLYTFASDMTPGHVTGDNKDGFHLAK
jgi:predicted lipoprotein with Yx(FWY)xxD motif